MKDLLSDLAYYTMNSFKQQRKSLASRLICGVREQHQKSLHHRLELQLWTQACESLTMKILNAREEKAFSITAERHGATSHYRVVSTRGITSSDRSLWLKKWDDETVLGEPIAWSALFLVRIMVRDNGVVKGKNLISFVFSWQRWIK